MTRPGWSGHSRFDDVLAGEPSLEDDDLEEEPADVFFRRQVGQLQLLLEHEPPTDPGLRSRLERDLAAAERALAVSTIDQHWASGAGDRTLF